jgi:hypothetical protein
MIRVRVIFSVLAIVLPAGLLLAGEPPAPSGNPSPSFPRIETIVCIRHGEKPAGGLGTLDVQGLNRALALPGVLLPRYGKPAYIFAPDPAADKVTEGPVAIDGKGREDVCYVRPLLSIGPTAIRCELPINTCFGFMHIAGLEGELDKPLYCNALIFVAWEHREAEQFIRDVVRDHGGNPDTVPIWARDDFDSIYVARISRDEKGAASVTFRIDHEGLNGMSGNFPEPAGAKPAVSTPQ